MARSSSLAAASDPTEPVRGRAAQVENRGSIFGHVRAVNRIGALCGDGHLGGDPHARYDPLRPLPMANPPPIALLCAVRDEFRPLLRLLTAPKPFRAAGGSALSGTIGGRPVVLVGSGMGARAARRTAEWVLSVANPAVLVSCGFAGGLSDSVQTGDVVVANELFDPAPPEGNGPREWSIEPERLAAVRAAWPENLRRVEGRVASSSRVLSLSTGKRDFGRRHNAIAVDMESSGIARAANVRDVPVLVVRVILDDVNFDWPIDFAPLVSDEGRLRPWKLLTAIARRPSALPALIEVGRSGRRVAEDLSRALAAIVPRLPEGSLA